MHFMNLSLRVRSRFIAKVSQIVFMEDFITLSVSEEQKWLRLWARLLGVVIGSSTQAQYPSNNKKVGKRAGFDSTVASVRV